MKKLLLLLLLIFCALSVVAQAQDPTPTPTPILFGKMPLSTDISTLTHWIIVDGQLDVSATGGLDGVILNQQVAFGDGAVIAGRDDFKWDNSSKTLSIISNQGAIGMSVDINGSDFGYGLSIQGTCNNCVPIFAIGTNNAEGNNAYGLDVGAGTSLDTNTNHAYSVFVESPFNAGTVAAQYGLYISDQTGHPIPTTTGFGVWIADQGTAENHYAFWYDAPGVYRIKSNGVMAYYNPSFSPKYTPGATDYERVVQQWNGDVLEYGLEASGTGTLRKLRLIGAGVEIPGTTTNDDAAAGKVGEKVESLKDNAHTVSLTTNTAANVTSISLTAGDWDVEGNINFTETTSTVTARTAGISVTSATLPTDGSEAYCGVQSTLTSEVNSISLPRKRISLAAPATVYLVAKAVFSAGTCAGFGAITARRPR